MEQLISLILKVAKEQAYCFPGNKVMIFTVENEGKANETAAFRMIDIDEEWKETFTERQRPQETGRDSDKYGQWTGMTAYTFTVQDINHYYFITLLKTRLNNSYACMLNDAMMMLSQLLQSKCETEKFALYFLN